MKQVKQKTKIDAVKINRDFYYTLALLQYEAINYVAGAENDDDKFVRARLIIKKVQEIIKTVGGVTSENPGSCRPPCYMDSLWTKCICPHLDTGEDGTNIDPTDLVVVDG